MPMHEQPHVIETNSLVRRFRRMEAVNGLSLRVRPGRCYGFFGRNRSGKTTTIKCLLNLLRPTSGDARVFGLDPARHEVEVKSRLAYVPDHVAFYPTGTSTTNCKKYRLRHDSSPRRSGLNPAHVVWMATAGEHATAITASFPGALSLCFRAFAVNLPCARPVCSFCNGRHLPQ